MNKLQIASAQRPRWWKNKKVLDVLMLGALAFLLIFAVWKVFYVKDGEDLQSGASEQERKVELLLSEMRGVGEVSVMIYEEDEQAVSAVVVCEGANNLMVITDIREAVSAMLGVEEKAVKVYLKSN